MVDTMKESAESVPCREKYWEEMSPDEKLTKLGEAVITQQYRIEELLNVVAELGVPHAHLDGVMVRAVHSTQGMNPGMSGLYRRDILNQAPAKIGLPRRY